MSSARHIGKIIIRASTDAPILRSSSPIIVSGGMGTLGTVFSSWIAENGPFELVLVGRNGKLSNTSEKILSTTALTVGVRSDLSSTEESEALVDGRRNLGALLHAGGVLQDATLGNQTAGGARAVAAPKLGALARLAATMELQPVSSAVLFSSIASLVGSPGQTNYSAANAGLDQSAHIMRASGGPAFSVQWGAWSG